jgi:ribosomal protein L16 Arg81 hydroxylase
VPISSSDMRRLTSPGKPRSMARSGEHASFRRFRAIESIENHTHRKSPWLVYLAHTAMTLDDVLRPTEVHKFLTEYVGRRYLLVRGCPGRFAQLLTWGQLDDVLSRLRVTDGRVKMVKKAATIREDTYVFTSKSDRSRYLNGPAVTAHALDGATLVVNQLDELVPAVRRLTESCEQVFQIYVQANLYAGWRSDNGFDVHWDRHDTLIVQLIGRKNWKVWEPTRLHPLPSDSADRVPRPSADPIWQGTLEDGDVLYMPRGWWHVAYPRDEPSVHITLGLRQPTGIDLLQWAVAQLSDIVATRKDVPHWQCECERKTWMASLRAACLAALSDDVIERYMVSLGAAAHPRPMVRLPRTVSTCAFAIEDRTALRLIRGRRLHVERRSGDGMLTFQADGHEWRCHEGLAPALALLNHIEPCTLAEMRGAMEDRWRPLLAPMIQALVRARVVWAESITLTDE